MAAAIFNRHADPSKATAISAGTQPAEKIHDCVMEAMNRVGFDLSSSRPRLLTAQLAQGADLLITMGCGEECPYIDGIKREDWPLTDPKGKSLEEVLSIKDEIEAQVISLLRKLDALDSCEQKK